MHSKNCQLNCLIYKKSNRTIFYPTDLVITKNNYPLEDHCNCIDIYLDFASWGLLSFICYCPILIHLKEGNHFKLKQLLFYCFEPKGNPKPFVKFICLHARLFLMEASVFKVRYRNAVSSEDTPAKTRLGGQLFYNPN